MNMKHPAALVVIIAYACFAAAGEDTVPKPTPETEQQVYGGTPEKLVPYGRFTEPYKRFFLEPNEYRGYGRHIPEPEHVDAVKIGFLGPIEATVSVATGGASHEEPLGRKMLQGAQLAIEHANARGGYRGSKTPYKLVIRNDNGLWGASGNEIVHLAYEEKVWAILGTIDGANSHIAIRVALKAEVPMMNTGDTDPTFIETAIPWVCRNITDDRQMSYLLADYVFGTLELTRVAALRANNRYGRMSIDEFRDAATRLGHPFLVELNYQLGDTDFEPQLERIKALNPKDPGADARHGDGPVVHRFGPHCDARVPRGGGRRRLQSDGRLPLRPGEPGPQTRRVRRAVHRPIRRASRDLCGPRLRWNDPGHRGHRARRSQPCTDPRRADGREDLARRHRQEDLRPHLHQPQPGLPRSGRGRGLDLR